MSSEKLRLYEYNVNHNLVDCLSYVDNVPIELEKVVKDLVQDEMKLILDEQNITEEELLKKYLLPLPYEHKKRDNLYNLELERIKNGQEMTKLNFDNYNANTTDLNNVKMLLQYSNTAMINLEILDRYKEGQWLKHLDDITLLKLMLTKKRDELRSDVEEYNKKRKLSQINWIGQLKLIEKQCEDYKNEFKVLLDAVEDIQKDMKV